MTGIKHDQEKRDLTILPLDALEAVAEVMEHGAEKYARHNWKSLTNGAQRFSAANLRHTFRDASGEELDKEWGLLHLAHAACSALMALSHRLRDKQQAYLISDEFQSPPSKL